MSDKDMRKLDHDGACYHHRTPTRSPALEAIQERHDRMAAGDYLYPAEVALADIAWLLGYIERNQQPPR